MKKLALILLFYAQTGWCGCPSGCREPFDADAVREFHNEQRISKLEDRVKKLEDGKNKCFDLITDGKTEDGQFTIMKRIDIPCDKSDGKLDHPCESDNSHLLPCSAPGKCTGGPS